MVWLKTLTIPPIDMVGLKVVVFLAVLSLTSACSGKPKTDCTCHKKGPTGLPGLPGLPIPGPKGLHGLPVPSPGPNKKKPVGFSWVSLKCLLNSIAGGVVKESKSILYDIIHLDVAGALDDVLSVVVSLGRALGLIIDVLIPGLGELFGKLVIAIVRIIICILGNKGGSSGLLGGLLGTKKSRTYAACGPDYGCKWGWKRYDGKWDNHQNILRHYGCEDASVQLKLILKKYLNGRDIDSLSPVHRILHDEILILVNLSIKIYSTWCKNDIITVYISIVTIISVLGNSCKPGLGIQIVDELESFCCTHFENGGYKNIKTYNSEIKKKVEHIKCWRWKGVIISEDAEKSSALGTSNYDSSDESEVTRKSTGTSEEKNESNESRDRAQTRSDSNSDSSQIGSNTETAESIEEKSGKSSTKSRATDSSETNNDYKSTDKSSDHSQTSRDTSDSDSVGTGKRQRTTMEEVSGSAKENREYSKTETSDTSNVELDQTKTDSKEGTTTETKLLLAKASSAKEGKTAASSEQQYSSKKTVVENC